MSKPGRKFPPFVQKSDEISQFVKNILIEERVIDIFF